MNLNIDVIVFIIIAVILFLAVKYSIPHFKGQGACCGGGGKTVRVKPKKLGKVISTRIVRIEGMHCEHCYTRVHNVLNSIEGVSARVNGRKGQALVKLARDINNTMIEQAISDLGYKVVSIDERQK